MELLEIVFVLAILLLIFGPKKLPELAKQLGEAFYEFKRSSSNIFTDIKSPSNIVDSEELKALNEIAEKLNINIREKSISQITQQIIKNFEKENVKR